jgi:hypothetical protein
MTDADGYIAKPSGECCLKGSLHDGDPRGKYQTVHGVNTYISSPSADKDNGNIVLYFPGTSSLVVTCSNSHEAQILVTVTETLDSNAFPHSVPKSFHALPSRLSSRCSQESSILSGPSDDRIHLPFHHLLTFQKLLDGLTNAG